MLRFSPRANRAHLVRWRDWTDEAFSEARAAGKPVVLFLTAFWCGVCQRMDETTLSDDEVVALLNALFIPIRVEESQRPDVDLRYNRDGWPTVAFLTPDGAPILTVNYLLPGRFRDLLADVHRLYASSRRSPTMQGPSEPPNAERLPSGAEFAALAPRAAGEIVGTLEGLADAEHGGFADGKNKYLHPEATELLMHLHQSTGEPWSLDHAAFTLEKMRASRTYDAQDGGFFRYSTKPDWSEPHPEKLLNDQAALLRNFLWGYLLTGRRALRETAQDLVRYLDDILLAPSGLAFFGCQDYVRMPADGGPPQLRSFVDELVYCDANALAVRAYLDVWWMLGDAGCRTRAVGVLESLWERLRAPGEGMFHWWDGHQGHDAGMLADATAMGLALLDAYAMLGDATYLQRAQALAGETMRNHRHAAGGFTDTFKPGPAASRLPVKALNQNAAAALFFIRLSDLSGDPAPRAAAHWALAPFIESYRPYGAFAAGYGHALARLQSRPLIADVTGQPGDAATLVLARAAATQMKHGDVVFRFREAPAGVRPSVRFVAQGAGSPPYSDPRDVTPARLVADLSSPRAHPE
jgi:uncharacterized protein YyaL (SSP411 family)